MNIEDFESVGDITSLIASLAPDVSWVDNLPIPTPDDIRARVSRFSSQERAAAEREAIRVEVGDAALTLATGFIDLGNLDEAERWLTVADEHQVSEAKDWLDRIAVLRTAKDAHEEGVLYSSEFTAVAMRHAVAILEIARIESDELVDAALAKVADIVARARYNAAKSTLSASLTDLVELDPGDERKKPTLLWPLWLLFDWLGLPIAKPFNNRAALSAVRVQRGTELSNLLSPIVVKEGRTDGGVYGFAFRVLFLENCSHGDSPWLSIDVGSRTRRCNLLQVAVEKLRRPDHTNWVERSHRLLVALPRSLYVRGGEPNTDILAALFEHVIPEHGLTTEQLKRLAWETVQDIIDQWGNDTLPLLTNPLDTSDERSASQNILHFGTRLFMDREIQVQWWRNDRPQTGENPIDDSAPVRQDMQKPKPESDFRCHSLHDRQGNCFFGFPDSMRIGYRQPTAEKPHGDLGSGQANPKSMTVDQALRELDETGGDYILFDDTDSGHPTVVYRRAGLEQGVMRLAESVEEYVHDAVQMLSSSVLAQKQPKSDHAKTSDTHEDRRTSKTDQNDNLDDFDEFLIIDCLTNPS